MSDASAKSARAETILLVLGLALLAWMLLPVLTANHFEAVSYSTASLSLSGFGDAIYAQNPRQPAVPEFIFATRTGVVVLLRALNALTGAPDLSYRVLAGCGVLAIIGAGWHCARVWSAVPPAPWTLAWAVVFLPGPVSLGYSFNDNVVATAFASLGVAVLARAARPDMAPADRLGAARHLAAGLLFGLAVTVRIDTLLLAPALAILAWLDRRTAAGTAKALALQGLGFLAVCLATRWLTGFDLVTSLGISSAFGVTNMIFHGPVSYRFAVYVAAVGVPATLLLGLAYAEARGDPRQRAMALACVAAILILAAGFAGAVVPRYLYSLASVVLVPVVAHGLGVLGRARPSLRWPVAVVLVGVLFAPPVIAMIDGPRPLLGLAALPQQARLWQRSVEASRTRYVAQVEAAEARPGTTTFLTAHFNEEYLLKYILRARGYAETSPDGTACDAVAIYRRGDRAIPIIPVDKTYQRVEGSRDLIWAISVLEAARCPLTAVPKTTLTGFDLLGPELRSFDPVQTALRTAYPNPVAKETIIPVALSADAVAERRALACTIATDALGGCDAERVHRRYQAYLAGYAAHRARPAP
ncbi:hypothetical protein [Methylobacterium sp. J-090]|uniref:hypothetical protein n=1 Tax=Methylobacterium sp. J-090 TaxID=2836666 RepID=UPI001FBBF18E|nr:hypothetical protein [Methylobacterium sp. J-090]MCJ2081054.1 hypothetical protein [Methylobacterium sp. J-090]